MKGKGLQSDLCHCPNITDILAGFLEFFLPYPKARDTKYLSTDGLNKRQIVTLNGKMHKLDKIENRLLPKKQSLSKNISRNKSLLAGYNHKLFQLLFAGHSEQSGW